MIENDAQLAATLDYIAKWADALEGMRRHEAEGHGGVFPTLAAGPLQEIRANAGSRPRFRSCCPRHARPCREFRYAQSERRRLRRSGQRRISRRKVNAADSAPQT